MSSPRMSDPKDTIAFLFPGQGAQYVGMGKDVCEVYPEAAGVFEEADKILGFRFPAFASRDPPKN